MKQKLYDPPAASNASSPCQTSPQTEVEKARKIVCDAQAEYQKAIYGATEISDSLWTVLLATGATAIGLALTGTTGNPLLATTLFTTTGAVGGKLLLQPEARGAVFQAGAEATACLLSATAPLVPADSGLTSLAPLFDPKGGSLAENLATLKAANDKLKLAIAQAEDADKAANEDPAKDPEISAASEVYDAARSLAETGNTAYVAAAALRTQLSVNVANMLAALQRIRAAVSGAARSASPDLGNLQSALKSVKVQTSDMIGFLVPVGPANQAGMDAKKSIKGQGLLPSSPLQLSVNAVVDAIGPVSRQVSLLATVTPTIHVADMNGAMQDCVNKVQNLELPSVTPLFLQLKPGETGHVSVSGGSGNYTTDVIPSSTDIKVTQTTVGTTKSAKLDVAVAATAASGKTYTLLVSDPERRFAQRVTVEVVATPAVLSAKSSATDPLLPKKGSNVIFTISGGTPPYKSLGPATTDAESTAALVVDPIGDLPADKPTITVTLTDKAQPNKTYKTLVRDAAKTDLSVEVKVSAASTSATILGGADVRKVQEALKKRGNDPGPVDGILGPRTKAAIRQFQKSAGLEETGELDAKTLEKLNAG